MVLENELNRFVRFIGQHARLFILTGAGISTASGIPAYRNERGQWLARTPIQHQDFVAKESTRQRYWARSLLGWPLVSSAKCNAAHKALAHWQRQGIVELLVTQNVDGLHRQAGSSEVVELHGRIDQVVCLSCNDVSPRDAWQAKMEAENSSFLRQVGRADVERRPDGDAEFGGVDIAQINCPQCPQCGGVIMPNVVFFGGSVPIDKVNECYLAVQAADALLVLGSSLAVYSGFRFVKRARELGKPIAIINLGETRADSMADYKFEADCVTLLNGVSELSLA